MLNPAEDGITHINVYSQGKTELGRLLSNFAHTPFSLDKYEFASVEAWWYWHKMRQAQLITHRYSRSDFKRMRSLYGFEAKKWGKIFLNQVDTAEIGLDELKKVYKNKLYSNPNIFESLMTNQLPLEHYYVYADVVRVADKYQWTVKLWEQIKEEIKQRDGLQNIKK